MNFGLNCNITVIPVFMEEGGKTYWGCEGSHYLTLSVPDEVIHVDRSSHPVDET